MSFIKFHADQLFDGYRFRKQDEVLVTDEKGKVYGIIPLADAGEDIRKVEGILCPGFVNAHCHLELSFLKGVIPTHTGLVGFVSQVMQHRNAASEIIEQSIIDAEAEMIANGIVAVGDICNTPNTIAQKQKGRVRYQNFIEVAGFVPGAAESRFNAIKEIAEQFYIYFPNNTSIVPHAPYSVSLPLLDKIKEHSRNKIFSIHNQESVQETLFFKEQTGDFLSLYNNLGVDLSFFKNTYKSSVEYYIGKIAKEMNALFVHNTFTAKEDIDYIVNQINNPYFCLCPAANLYIENSLPNINLFRSVNDGNNIVVGTDSLASNNSLNILGELSIIQQHFPVIEVEELLKWATINGARALTLEKSLGSFEINKQPGVLQIFSKKNLGNNLVNSTIKVFL